jgi:circadian clock protein KaiC
MAKEGLVRTGIAGLDTILMGGIPRTNVILVQGTVGSGKTLLGLEFIYRGITDFNEPGIIVVFETSPQKLIRDAASFGWKLQELQDQKKLQVVFTSPEVLDQEMRSPDSLLLETALEMGAQRIFIDGVGLLRPPSANGGLTSSSAASYRDLLQQLIEGLNRENLTAMLSHEVGSFPESQLSLESAGFLADTVIQLNRSVKNRRAYRSIEIVKSRGQDYVSGLHTLQITDGKGLEVFRRVQSPLVRESQPSSKAKRSVIGVGALDDLMGGGIFDGSTTMVVGISGAGKTVLGAQLLQEGIKKQKSRGLLISLDEHPAQIIRNAETVGISLQPLIESGDLHILFESPQELDIDAHYQRIVETIEKHNIQRLVIDGMTSYSTALEDQGIYRDFIHALVSFTKYRLMSTFFNYENPEFLGITSYMPNFPVSSIVDNIILLSLIEIRSSLRRCLTVVKSRGCKHEFDSREFQIGEGGITLLPFEEDITEKLPLARYSSVLSRAPTRYPFASGLSSDSVLAPDAGLVPGSGLSVGSK